MELKRSVTNEVKVEAAYGVGRFDVDIQIITVCSSIKGLSVLRV